ncbi:MAG: hypothetical protein CMP57_02370 [Flavobacteriales bacterium]|nr:hypothetical protein [Flavobacteriales bacterium]|tara:strand:+ start:520 stop:1158 length:639 start_codon:yes stop_codon:yes gene_type:complete
MIRSLFLFYLFQISTLAMAQISSNPEAKRLLDEVSQATDKLDAIEIIFQYTLTNKEENIGESSMGELSLKKNQYILSFMDVKQISDGENVWTILEDDGEIQISEIDLEDENALTPSNFLKMYEKGFIYQMGEKIGNLQIIELNPDNPDDVDYIKIHLLVDTEIKQIKNLKQFGKNATESEYIINNFIPSLLDDSAFIFNESDYPGFEITDLR